jgi:hypothetical protein
MSWLKRVIARLLTPQTQPLDKPVLPTQTVGLANKERITKTGNKRSVVASSKPLKSATKKPNSKPKSAQSTKVASSRKAETKSAQAECGQIGKQRKTPVRPTPQPVKSAPKAKRSLAK